MTPQEKAFTELCELLQPELEDDAKEAAEALVRYMGLVVGIYQAIESDPERKGLIEVLTKNKRPSTMAPERSFTNQYEKP